MKAKIFALSLLAAISMASCSDSLDTDITSAEQGELTTYKFKTKIILPQEMAAGLTRAGEDPDNSKNNNHTDGDNKEWKVDNDKVYFALYSANGAPLQPASLESTLNDQSWTPVGNKTDLVTTEAIVTLKASQKPKYLVVFVNLHDKEKAEFLNMSLNNLLTGETGSTHFLPGKNYLASNLGIEGEKFYQRPASFRNMMIERYANLSGDGSFFMMNSSWNKQPKSDDQGHHNVRAVDISNDVYEESQFVSTAEPALVYVERVVAKVNTLFRINNDDLDAGGVVVSANQNGYPVIALKQKKGYNNGTYSEDSDKPYASETYFVKFDGWQLNATNKSFKPLKDIGETPSYFNNVAGINYQAFREGRSYWAVDQNYSNADDRYLNNQEFTPDQGWAYTKKPDLNYYTLTNMKRLKFGLYPGIDESTSTSNASDISDYTDYCFENTMDGTTQFHTGAVTHVLVRAQYGKMNGTTFIPYGKTSADGPYVKNSDGTYKNIYRVGKTIYEEEGLINYIYDHLKQMYTQMEGKRANIKLEHNNKNFYDHKDVKSQVIVTGEILKDVKYTGLDDNKNAIEKTVGPDGDVTEIVFGEATIYTFERGICYYSIPIKHFWDGSAENYGLGKEGYYGVVRNHWYQVEITGVSGFGHPATPGEGPGNPSDTGYDPDKPYDPEKPGVGDNPKDPDNPKIPHDPTQPGYPTPSDPTNPTDPHNPHNPTDGTPDPGKPIIPEDTEDDDFNLNARIRVLSWAKMKMEAQLGGMQSWQ